MLACKQPTWTLNKSLHKPISCSKIWSELTDLSSYQIFYPNKKASIPYPITLSLFCISFPPMTIIAMQNTFSDCWSVAASPFYEFSQSLYANRDSYLDGSKTSLANFPLIIASRRHPLHLWCCSWVMIDWCKTEQRKTHANVQISLLYRWEATSCGPLSTVNN